MRKNAFVDMPPIAVEERPEKLLVVVPTELKTSLERFAQFFAEATGQTPSSFNAVVTGVLAGYLKSHVGFQRWLKTAPPAAGAGTQANSA